MKRTIFFITLFCQAVFAYCAWQLPVYNYFQSEYNAGTQNWQIRQQKNGWIYTANNYGLLQYDGFSWWKDGIWNSTVLRSLEIAENGEIYVGGSNEFGVFNSNNIGMLSYRPLSNEVPNEHKIFGEIWNIHILNKDVYFQANNILFKLEQDGKMSVIKSKSKILTSAKIRDGIYIATADGIYLLSGQQFNALNHSNALPCNEIKQMVAFGENGILIATTSHGLFLFDGEKISKFPTEVDNFIFTNQIYSLAVSDKHIAIGTVHNGLVIIDLETKKCNFANTGNGLQNNTILSMCFDDNNNLWLGLDNGIDRVVINSPIRELYGRINSYGSWYSSLISNGTLYLATNQGLYYTSYPMNQNEQLTRATLISGSQGQVWNVDTLGNSLICCHNRGLFSVADGKLLPISEDDGFWKVRIMPKMPNYAVAGSYSGLYLLKKDGNTWKILRKINGFDKTSRSFEIDVKNRVVMVSDIGIERLTFDKSFQSVTTKIVVKAHNANDYFSLNKIDNKLIISNNNVCLRTDKNGEFVNDTAFFNSLEGTVHYTQIKLDAAKNIWYIVSDKLKVLAFDKKTGKYAASPVQLWNIPGFFVAGFASLNPIGNNQAITGDVSGFALADLNNIKTMPKNRELFIRSIFSTNESDSLIYGENFPKIPTELEIPYKNNSIRITFGGTFALNSNQEYRYYLYPIERDFGSWNNSNIKEYTSLKEGKYRFVVEKRNNYSDIIYKTEIAFEILPPFYRSWWAYIIYSAIFLTLGYIIYKYFMLKIEKSKRKEMHIKEQEMKEKEIQYLKEQREHEKKMFELKNENIKIKLKNKTQELSNILLNHVDKKEILIELKQDLKKIQTDLQEKNYEQAIRKIVILQGKISQNVEQDIDWTRFEENFDIANDYFLDKLTKQFPWLNKNERKLCTYIKMGLLTKEIAPLMNLSTRGVEMMRYRMRKKMDLGREDDLEIFFQVFNKEMISEEDDEEI